MAYLEEKVVSSAPRAEEFLARDLETFEAYEKAADTANESEMDRIFNGLSWGDHRVLECLPLYLASEGAQRSRVDYAFNALVPRPAQVSDVRLNMMHQWVKARLFSYDSKSKFEFSPYKQSA